MEDGLFREEALRRWREAGTKGEVLRLAPEWTSLASTLLVFAVLGAGVAALFVTVQVSVQGPATVTSPGQVLVLLPAGQRADLRPGSLLLFRREDGRDVVPLRIERVEPRVLGREEARSLAGGAFAGRAVPDAAVLVRAAPTAGDPLEGPGRAILPLGRRRLVDFLFPGR